MSNNVYEKIYPTIGIHTLVECICFHTHTHTHKKQFIRQLTEEIYHKTRIAQELLVNARLIVHLRPIVRWEIRNMRSSDFKNSLERPRRRSSTTKQPAVISRLLYFSATVHIARTSPARCHPLRRM